MASERTILVCSDPKGVSCTARYEKSYGRYLVLAEARVQGWGEIPGTNQLVCPDCKERSNE